MLQIRLLGLHPDPDLLGRGSDLDSACLSFLVSVDLCEGTAVSGTDNGVLSGGLVFSFWMGCFALCARLGGVPFVAAQVDL